MTLKIANLRIIASIILLFSINAPSNANIVSKIRTWKIINQSTVITKDFKSMILPFEMIEGKIVVVMSLGNGANMKPYKFILDTGAPTVLSTDVAFENKLNVKAFKGKNLVSTPGGISKSANYLSSDVIYSLGNCKIKKKLTLTRDLSVNIKNKCNGISGMLGSDILHHFTMVIDFKKNIITLFNPNDFKPNDCSFKDSMDFSVFSLIQKTPILTLDINGEKLDAVFDIGYNGTVLMQFPKSTSKTARYFMSDTSKQKIETYGSLATVDGQILGKRDLYRIGNVSLKQENTRLNNSTVSFQINEKLDENRVNIGVAVMENYLLAIDWKNEKIYFNDNLQKDKTTAKEKLPPICQVYYFSKEKKFRIVAISIDSKFYEKGLKAGDEVLKVNGQVLKNLIGSGVDNECEIREKIDGVNRDIKNIEVTRDNKIIEFAE